MLPLNFKKKTMLKLTAFFSAMMFSSQSLAEGFPSQLIERAESKNKILLTFAIEQCKPKYLTGANGEQIETYSGHWPCNLPKGKRFNSNTPNVFHMHPDRKTCPPSEKDIAILKGKWKCLDENWRLTIKQNRQENTFTAAYIRQDNK